MNKDTYYFSHDYNARSDRKIKRMMSQLGLISYGVYWAIVEDLYNNANALPTDYKSIAFDLRTTEKIVKSVVEDFELFVISDGFFGSQSIERRLDERALKSQKARESARQRWDKPKTDANALETQSDSNAIKERKGKKKKEKEIDDNGLIKDLVFISDEWKPIFITWLKYKSEKQETYKSNMSKQACINKLQNLSNNNLQIAKEIVEQSMANNYSGLFELKATTQPAQKETPTIGQYKIIKTNF